MSLDLRGNDTRYGTSFIPCADSPITTVSFLWDNPYVPAGDISVVADRADSPALWAATVSPTDAPD